MLKTFFSFSNKLSIEKRNYARSLCFNFFNELSIERKNMLVTFVSFFDELSTDKKNCARDLFLIMASKRIIIWKEYMLRDKHKSWLPSDIH
jgi:hypothetical protein